MNPGKEKSLFTEAERTEAIPAFDDSTCSICGSKLPADSSTGLCPVCLLRGALDDGLGADSAMNEESLIESAIDSPEIALRRFGHYEILKQPDGSLHELGHGAMGITFKAIDLNLRMPVTLKVLNLRLFQDEAARRRFLREARAAASVRHANVASVYHLGSRGREIFYAMEFVNGETLEALIKRSGRLGVKLALEISTQIAAGLTAIDKQNLVHRDIKPSNIMVSWDEESGGTVKIIDLGLAKAVSAKQTETSISMPGAFAGTPEFASPEQISGISVDIRSDLYSLGVTLWKMLCGRGPFEGRPVAVMHQHQHLALPFEQLHGIPQPLFVLLEALLEKDPALRMQAPADVLKAMPAIISAVEEGRTITRQSLRSLPLGEKNLCLRDNGDLSANDLYLRGLALVELLDADANQKAMAFFQKAIEQDPNFALAYAGLARASVEQWGLGGEKSLLDSAVGLCRLAIALDPMQVRGHHMLARAYYMKGWYPQCDEALRKALELAPNDYLVNGLAALRELTRHQFSDSYQYFRKAHSLNPNDTRSLYVAAEILFRADLGDVADKWMHQALETESNPQRHHMMECYRMMWRRKFVAARAGFAQLPPELKSYDFSASEGLLFCAIGVGDWAAVIQSCQARLAENPDKIWPRTYLAIALQMSGRQTEAREMAEQVVKCGLERLERPAQPDVPWDVPLYVSWAYRLLDLKDEAYRYLGKFLGHRTLLQIQLGLDNPMLEVFKNDPEFKTILADMNQKFEIARRSIREHEAASAHR